MVYGQRNQPRLLAQHLGVTSVTLNAFLAPSATLLDISVGGLRLLFEDELPPAALETGRQLAGIIESKSLPSRLHFSGNVVWFKRVSLVGEPATMVGLSFSGDTVLPAELLRLIENFAQAD